MRTSSSDRLKFFARKLSLFDRVALVLVVLYLLARIPEAMGRPLPGMGFLALLGLISLGYLVVRLFLIIRRNLLWRLRNRLIVAYIFIAVVPVLLLIAMAFLATYLLELQIGAHLLRDDIAERVDMISADASAIAGVVGREPDLKPAPPAPPRGQGRGRGGARGLFQPNGSQPNPPAPLTADQLENQSILTRPGVSGVIAAAQTEWPDLNVLLNIGSDMIRDKTSSQFSGLVELRGQLFFASVQVLPVAGGRNTVLVAAPVTPELLDQLPSKLGPVELRLLSPVSDDGGPGRGRPSNVPPQKFTIAGTTYFIGQEINSRSRTVPPVRFWGDIEVNGLATLEALRVQPRVGGGTDLPVLVTYSFRLSEVNGNLLTSLGDIAPWITEILFAALLVFLVLELAALATGVILTRTITHSVADLYDATHHIRSGDFAHRIRIQRHDQLGALAESFNEMTGSIAELIEGQRQRQRLENEVSIARDVQRQLFPKKLPTMDGLELAAICRAARAVSGDYYDFIPLGGTRMGIALADISGKGIFASLLMASLQAALRSAASMNVNLGTAEVVTLLNTQLFQTTSDDRYATLFYAVYDTEKRTLTYTNAGHLPPLLLTDGRVQALSEGGTVIGLLEESTYTQGTVQVSQGSTLLIFSDGLTEPENVFGEEYGVERLREEFIRSSKSSARALAEDLIETVERWSSSPEQADDMTVVVARIS